MDRLKTIQAVVAGQIKAEAGAARPNLTRRQVNRPLQPCLTEGAGGLVSHSRGKPSNFQLRPGVAENAFSTADYRAGGQSDIALANFPCQHALPSM